MAVLGLIECSLLILKIPVAKKIKEQMEGDSNWIYFKVNLVHH